MNPRSKTAITNLANSFKTPCKVLFAEDGSWARLSNEDITAEAHKLASGKWIIAAWSERHNQWQSDDFTRDAREYNPSSVYCFANSLEGLRKNVRCYKSAAEALKNYTETLE